MTNEVTNAAPVVYPVQPRSIADTKSAAPSESGKQVPPSGEVEPESNDDSKPPEAQEIVSAVELLSAHARSIGHELQFEIDASSGQTLIRVIDPETQELLRQIPSEEAVARARSSDDAALNLIDDMV